MSKAIVIGTYKGRENWLADCLDSLKGYERYPVIACDVPWELGVIGWAYPRFDEFLFLQDSVIVKQLDWIDEVFDCPKSVSLCHNPFFMYLGKYTRKDLDKVELPDVSNKREAVEHEGSWTKYYASLCNPITLWPLVDTDIFVEKHGRKNMVLENEYIVKYKGTWHPDMIKEENSV